jgi:HEPN domain-containing protein
LPGPDGRVLATRLSGKARSDEIVLDRLLGDPLVPDDVLGFHAQQAVEKLLKAALASIGVAPPRTHDLGRLVAVAGEAGLAPPPAAREARRLAPWAVEFRYGDSLDDELDRRWARETVAAVRAWLDSILLSDDGS